MKKLWQRFKIATLVSVGFTVFITASLVLFAGCSAKKMAASGDSVRMAAPALAKEVQAEGSRSGAGFNPEGQGSGASAQTTAFQRKLIMTGNLSVEVDSLAAAETELAQWVASLGGYIGSSEMSTNRLNVTIRVPAANFEKAMQVLPVKGKLLNRSIFSEDVSEQYYDLSTRLQTRKILHERLQNYLKNAKNIEDMMRVETELNTVLSDIEVMEGQFRRLSSQIDYSTINIEARLPYKTSEQGFVWPDLGSDLKNLLGDSLYFLNNLIVGILYVIIFGVPIVLVLGLFYWLCFGRIGLVRKLFVKLSRKKEDKK